MTQHVLHRLADSAGVLRPKVRVWLAANRVQLEHIKTSFLAMASREQNSLQYMSILSPMVDATLFGTDPPYALGRTLKQLHDLPFAELCARCVSQRAT